MKKIAHGPDPERASLARPTRPRQSSGAIARHTPGIWTFLRELGRSHTGLALAVILAATILVGLRLMLGSRYVFCVEATSVRVNIAPVDGRCGSTPGRETPQP
jgi:hypothetical protein